MNSPGETPRMDEFLASVLAYKGGFSGGDTAKRRMLIAGLVERVVIDGDEVKIVWRL